MDSLDRRNRNTELMTVMSILIVILLALAATIFVIINP